MTSFLELTLLTAAVDHPTVASFAILALPPIMELAVPSTDTVGVLPLTVELGARADVPPPQVALVELHPLHTHPMANVEPPMEAFSAIPLVLFTLELAVPRTDGVGILPLTVGLAAKADVMAQPVVLGAILERLLQLQRRLEPKSPCWARLQLHLQMAVILLMVLVALGTGTPFVVTGPTALVVLFMG